MAKWGEGDPRWIVEERPDATNVNNWHWSEKNADAWSKKKLNELFTDATLEDASLPNGKVILESLDKCEGEARANNRKAKLIFFYEWELTLKWRYEPKADNDEEEVKGTVAIPNLSEEHTDMKDVDLEIAITTSPKKKEAEKEEKIVAEASSRRAAAGCHTDFDSLQSMKAYPRTALGAVS